MARKVELTDAVVAEITACYLENLVALVMSREMEDMTQAQVMLLMHNVARRLLSMVPDELAEKMITDHYASKKAAENAKNNGSKAEGGTDK